MENYIQNQFVTYEIALALRELCFDEECLAGYMNNKKFYLKPNYFIDIQAPLWQQVIDWFREKFDMIILVWPFEKISEGHFNNWINLRKIHYFCEIYSINKRVIDVETINKAKIMVGDTSTNETIFTDDTLLCRATVDGDYYYEAREQAILKCIELCTEKQ